MFLILCIFWGFILEITETTDPVCFLNNFISINSLLTMHASEGEVYNCVTESSVLASPASAQNLFCLRLWGKDVYLKM